MALITCPECAAQITDPTTTCPNCGKRIQSPPRVAAAPIRHAGGKLQAVGIIMVAASIIATLTGAWWGAALLFPAVVIFFMGKFL